MQSRACICKRLWSPGIDSEELGPPAHVDWRASTTNRVIIPAGQAGNRFFTNTDSVWYRTCCKGFWVLEQPISGRRYNTIQIHTTLRSFAISFCEVEEGSNLNKALPCQLSTCQFHKLLTILSLELYKVYKQLCLNIHCKKDPVPFPAPTRNVTERTLYSREYAFLWSQEFSRIFPFPALNSH